MLRRIRAAVDERDNSHMNRRVLWLLVVAVLSSCAAPASEGASATATPTSTDAHPSQSPVSSAGQTASPKASALPSGLYGPLWELDPAIAFQAPASCENLAGAPTMEFGQNVAWGISYPNDWSAQESYLGECMWFGAEPWEPDLEAQVPPDVVAIVIRVLDGRVTPNSHEFEGGSVTREQEFTVAGAPAVRYEISGADAEFLMGDGVIWVVGVEGELPDFNELSIPYYLVIYTSSPDSGALAQKVEILDRMVATLQILTP